MQHTMHNFLPAPYCCKLPGIYAIVNRNNNKVYIGSAVKMFKRWNSHRYDFFRNRHNPHLMRAFTKDPSAFYFEVVEELPGADKARRLEREQFWMDFYQSCIPSKGYNACPKAESCEGAKHGPEYGARISKFMTGRKMSPERLEIHKRAMVGHKGRKFTAEQKLEQSLRFKGRPGNIGSTKFKKWKLDNPNYFDKPVIQMLKTGETVRRFGSIVEAEEFFGGRTNIHAVCKGKRPMCLGYKWRYENAS